MELEVRENHIHHITNLRAKFLRRIPVDNCDLNEIFAVNHGYQITDGTVTIRLNHPVHLRPSKAKQHIGLTLKRRRRQIGGDIPKDVDQGHMGGKSIRCFLRATEFDAGGIGERRTDIFQRKAI